ncbi:MAG TPA: YihY/virulence factor BrkB family protein [Dehalococcoidia bacterium]|nr:YihY/virulence factor BrkB family protein [Dehalococcoidia bacterium]
MTRLDATQLGKRLVPALARLYKEMREDDVLGIAAELAFRFFLALFPFFIFLAALGGFVADMLSVSNPTEEIINLFGGSLPTDTESVIRTQVDAVVGSSNAGLLSIGMLGALFAASGGVGTIMKASNRAYGVRETRPALRRYALAVVLTILGGLLLVAAFVLFLAGQVYGSDLDTKLGIGGFTADILSLARWPAVTALALIATAVLYWATPATKLPFRLVTPGSLIFVVGWLAVSYVFGVYVANFGSFNTTYGTLGGVAITLTWFYFTGAILIAGIEVNAMLDHDVRQAKEAPPDS